MARYKQKKYKQDNDSEYQIKIHTNNGTRLLKEIYKGIVNARKGKMYFINRGIKAEVVFKTKLQ